MKVASAITALAALATSAAAADIPARALFGCEFPVITIAGSSIPDRLVTPNPTHSDWQNFNNGAKSLRVTDVPESYDVINISFNEVGAEPGQIGFRLDSAGLNGYTEDEFIADVKTVKRQGRKVVLSIGGAEGTIHVEDDDSAQRFADSAYDLMQQYGFDGIDIDLENGLNPTYLAKAIRLLSDKVGPSLVYTMAPQTVDIASTSTTYGQLIAETKDILTAVMPQFYNSGSMIGCDGKVYSQGHVDFITAQACLLLQTLRPDQVALGVPSAPQGAGSGYVNPSIVNDAYRCLTTGSTGCGSFQPERAYEGLRGIMTWSINWDANNNWDFANTVREVLGDAGSAPSPPPPSHTTTRTPPKTTTRTKTKTVAPPTHTSNPGNPGGNAGECTDANNGDWGCDGSMSVRCINNEWVNVQDCPASSGLVCSPSGGCAWA
ncbi:hypothetical protein HK104_001615 [Borealophlyctis nickersoniae]|nr:hypothetical protein HK104_001615 [Borealophlyctis nickersoniae]